MPPAVKAGTSALWYRISVVDDRVDVAVRLFSPPPHTKFFLPTQWAGQDDLASGIGISGAVTPRGPAALQLDRQDGVLLVETTNVDWVEVNYRVDFSEQSPFHPQRGDGVFLGYGPTFLVTPAQQILDRTREIPIELHASQHDGVVATWSSFGASPSTRDATRTVHRFIASDGSALRDAFVVVGPGLAVERIGTGDHLVEVAFSPGYRGDHRRLADAVARLTDTLRDQYGAAGPTHVFIRARPTARGELGGFGRRGGFVLEIAPDTIVDDDTRLLVAHEALHIWNGHLLRPQRDLETATRWFKEGVTHYLALKTIAAADPFLRGQLATIASNYMRNPITHGAASQPVDETRWPYDYGALIALAMDAALLRAPNARGDASCWLQTLLRDAERAYDDHALLAAIQYCAGPSGAREVEQIWRAHVRNAEPLNLTELFASIGLHWLEAAGDRPARLVPLDGVPHHYQAMFGVRP